MKTLVLSFVTCLLSQLLSCSSNQPKTAPPRPSELKEPLMDANKAIAQKESDQIDAYIRQQKLDSMKASGTGLRYMIYKKGTGAKATNGMLANVSYKISLLDGRQCYSSEKDGNKEFLIGQDIVESGLHEGITYMKAGDKAMFIIPSHLAFGLSGDGNKIPPRSSVVYDIELLSLRMPQ